MMHHSSRRSFLNSLAILSAGTALSSVPGFLQPGSEKPGSELQHLWNSFCKRNGGRNISSSAFLSDAALPQPCKGHHYKTGKPVSFAGQDIVAVPAWIYWPGNSEKPSDLVITFFKDGSVPQKITRINRFELEGLSAWMETNKQSQILPAIFDARGNSTGITKSMKIKTRISKDSHADIVAGICNETVSFRKSLIHNS